MNATVSIVETATATARTSHAATETASLLSAVETRTLRTVAATEASSES